MGASGLAAWKHQERQPGSGHWIVMMIAYMRVVARDRAADRGCTGGGEVADDTGPPGEVPRGFFIFRALRTSKPGPRPWYRHTGPRLKLRCPRGTKRRPRRDLKLLAERCWSWSTFCSSAPYWRQASLRWVPISARRGLQAPFLRAVRRCRPSRRKRNPPLPSRPCSLRRRRRKPQPRRVARIVPRARTAARSEMRPDRPTASLRCRCGSSLQKCHGGKI